MGEGNERNEGGEEKMRKGKKQCGTKGGRMAEVRKSGTGEGKWV